MQVVTSIQRQITSSYQVHSYCMYFYLPQYPKVVENLLIITFFKVIKQVRVKITHYIAILTNNHSENARSLNCVLLLPSACRALLLRCCVSFIHLTCNRARSGRRSYIGQLEEYSLYQFTKFGIKARKSLQVICYQRSKIALFQCTFQTSPVRKVDWRIT